MKRIKITSPHNPSIKAAIRLKERPDRRKRLFILEGARLIETALAAGARAESIFFTERFALRQEERHFFKHAIENAERTSGALVAEITDDLIAGLTDTEAPQGIVAVVAYTPPELQDIDFRGAPFLVVCDGVSDPGNLGTIVRIADAAGADGVIALPGTCNAFSPKCIRATAGSLFNIPVTYSETDTLVNYLDKKGIGFYVADAHAGMSLYSAGFVKPVAVVFGNEACGVGETLKEKAESSIRIPIMGRAESLNVAMSAAVCLYEAVRQRLSARG